MMLVGVMMEKKMDEDDQNTSPSTAFQFYSQTYEISWTTPL